MAGFGGTSWWYILGPDLPPNDCNRAHALEKEYFENGCVEFNSDLTWERSNVSTKKTISSIPIILYS